MARGRRTRAALAGLSVVLGAGLTSCGGSGYEYVSNTDEGLFLRVPDDWSVIDVDTDDGTLGRPGVALDWVRVVDSSPTPSAANYANPVPADPVGIAAVEPVETAGQRDDLNIQVLRTYALANYISPESDDPTGATADPLAINQDADGPIEVISYEDDLTFEGGFRGQRIVFDLELDDGRVVTIDQTAVVDVDTTEVFRLLIKCEARCYADRQGEIDDIVDSWTIDQETVT
jgi:hypothetical protein